MSVNKYQPHVLVLPEDDANRQLANGFLLDCSTRQLQVLAEAGGWAAVRDLFISEHIRSMQQYIGRYMVLLVEFDDHLDRLAAMKERVPKELSDRVFVLGALKDPEALKGALTGKGLRSYEAIGTAMSQDCRNGTQIAWADPLLQHNEAELSRLRKAVCAVLFPAQTATEAAPS